MKKIIVKQDPEKEIPTEVMAEAIIDLSRAAKKLLNGKLRREAVVALIKDKSGLTKGLIETVLTNLEELERTWIRK